MNNNFNNNDTKQLVDFSDIDINEINVSSPQQASNTNLSKMINSNGFYNNLEDFDFEPNLRIKIFGVGGAGNNMIEHIAKNTNIDPKMLFAINTDYQVLKKMSDVKCNCILIGKNTTMGYGSGSNPLIGEKSANENRETIATILKDTDLLFILSGMGKGTGTGASPIIAEIAQELNILTISIVNIPSITTEGKNIFDKGILGTNNLKKHVDGLATINNDKILGIDAQNDSLYNCFKKVNEVISDIISDLINTMTVPSQINIDFNDIKTFFKEKTHFHITTCDLDNNENNQELLKQKIASSIFEDKIIDAKKVILTMKLNPTSVPKSFINDIRQVMVDLTKNSDLELMYSIDYSEDITFAKISLLIATNYFSDEKLKQVPPIMELNQQDQQLVSSVNENKDNNIAIQQQIQNNEFIDKLFSDIENLDKVASAQLDNKDTLDSYNLNEFDSFNNQFNELQNELLKQQKTNNNILNTSELSNQYPKQTTEINSTTLNRFISKTLSLFKNNGYNKENEK